ncbi:cerebellin-3-like [Littorina saxatilis]|uniref:cerebellin-3-like n=1 Tax=Littorina saxatilis TaxID=31220 RepID=UPI0038B65B99
MFSLITCCMLFACSVSSTVNAIRKRSDDINMPELQHVIQQQSAVIQTLQAKVTSMDHTMTSMGNTVKQQSAVMQTMQSKLMKHVGFSAAFQLAHDMVNIGQGGVIKFSNIITNSGSGYSATTGVFTAPVAGNYGFYLSFRSDNTHDYVVIALEKNNKALHYAVAEGKRVFRDKGACFATSHLNVGDKVRARQNDGDTRLELWRLTTFSGFLLLAD